MDDFFTINNIFLNENLKDKASAFSRVMEIFRANDAVHEEYLASMQKRDQSASVALGNFLALPHGSDGSDSLIKKNCVTLIHLKEAMNWDGEPVRFIFALALKNANQMDFIQKAGIAFSDDEEVKAILNKKDLNEQFLLDWIQNQ